MSGYQFSLASNFPTDCRIPHLENNHYIYGKGPIHQPSHLKYPSNHFSPAKNEPKQYSRSPLTSSSPYSASKSIKSTNPYTQITSDSPYYDQVGQKTSQLHEKRQEISLRESRLFNPATSGPSSNYEKFENHGSYADPSKSGHANHYPSKNQDSLKNSSATDARTMQEFQLFQEENLKRNLRQEENLRAQDEEKRLRLNREIAREQEVRRQNEIDREKLELEEFLHIKKREEERREREKQEYEMFLLRKQQIEAEKERTEMENQRKHEESLRIQKLQEYERIRQRELIDQREQMEQIELEKALNAKRQEEIARLEYEKAMEMRRREELARLEMERMKNQRYEKSQVERFNKEKSGNMKQVSIKYNEAKLEANGQKLSSRRKNHREDKCESEKGGVDQTWKNRENSEKYASGQAFNERQLALKEEIGRESRQFLRDKESKERNSRTDNQYSPKVEDQDYSRSESKLKERGSSSKSVSSKYRSISVKKNEPHYHQPTFSTKVKSMGNQSYKFAGAYKTGFN